MRYDYLHGSEPTTVMYRQAAVSLFCSHSCTLEVSDWIIQQQDMGSLGVIDTDSE